MNWLKSKFKHEQLTTARLHFMYLFLESKLEEKHFEIIIIICFYATQKQ